jgi:DNA repair protein RecN (Recombination protein N)
MLETYESFKKEVHELTNFDETITKLKKEIESIYAEALNMAKKLHTSRTKAAATLSKELTTKVRELKMNGASIAINLSSSVELNSKGATKIEFTAETNPGEGFYKVKEIASGGELSRILLSLRQILSSNDTISVFLFDEIDTGIGGETALSIGRSLQKVSESSQVISITHLPQIANYAEKLIWVSKATITKDDSNRTISQVEEIFGNKKKEAIKAMNPI